MKNYDPKKLPKFITNLNMNNLYGQAVSRYLSCGGFKWLKNADGFDLNSISEKSSIGYIFKDYIFLMNYMHNDYPLVPKKLAIPYDMLSDYCKKFAKQI